jgi:hypothetical protein
LTSISLPSGLISLGNNAFDGAAALTSIVIPEGVTSLGENAFKDATALKSVTIPSTVTSIGEGTFSSATALTSVTIPSGVTSIGNYAFSGTAALTSIAIPSSVTSIGDGSFSNTALTSVTVPLGVTSIGAESFSGNPALTSVAIPASVTTIGDSAFAWDPAMTSLSVNPGNQNYSSVDGVLLDKNQTQLLAYPAAKLGSSYVVKDTVTSIGPYAFAFVAALTSISIPASVTSIGSYAFYNTSALKSVDFSASVTSIESGTFSGSGLTSIIIPSGVTSIGWGAFKESPALTSVVIPASVTNINDSAFEQATSLMDVTFLGDVPSEYFGDNVFANHAEGAKVRILSTAKGFGADPTWNGLLIKLSYVATYDAAGGSNVSSGVFEGGGTIQTAPVSTRAGYNLLGWSATENGTVVSFPYTPTATGDITLHAIWAQAAVKPSYVSGAKLTGTAKVGKSITASKGTWSGTASIAYTYQWYLCKAASSKVLTTGNAGAKCTIVKNAKAASYKATVKEKGGYLAALITATNSAGKSTIFTSTTGKVS